MGFYKIFEILDGSVFIYVFPFFSPEDDKKKIEKGGNPIVKSTPQILTNPFITNCQSGVPFTH